MKKNKNIVRYVKFLVLYVLRPALPVNKNRFMFMSMSGNSYGGNSKALSDYIINQSEEYEIVWAESDMLEISDPSVMPVKLYTWKYYYYLLTCLVFVSDQRLYKPMMPLKRPGQFYIQLWHGTALKKIEGDIPDLDRHYVEMSIRDSHNTDLYVSGSSFMSDIFSSSFWYSGKILEVGTPRNDVFFLKDQVEKKKNAIYDFYKIPGSKILLYAPTFRANDSLNAYTIDTKRIAECLGPEWSVLVRLHPNLMNQTDKKEIERKFPNAIDASCYPDMQELLCATDLLITDYSSSMFDYMLMNKPCIIYASDIETYDRGFYMSIRQLPFPIAENMQELSQLLTNDFSKGNYDGFFEKIGSRESGNASRQIYDYLRNNVL